MMPWTSIGAGSLALFLATAAGAQPAYPQNPQDDSQSAAKPHRSNWNSEVTGSRAGFPATIGSAAGPASGIGDGNPTMRSSRGQSATPAQQVRSLGTGNPGA